MIQTINSILAFTASIIALAALLVSGAAAFYSVFGLSKLFAGAFAGTFSVSITYPTDLIRRRLQLQGFDKSVPKYDGIFDCCKKIFKRDGIKGFYRGLSATYIKTGPAV